MFRALLAHPQEPLHTRHLVYCVHVMSVGCYQGWSGTAFAVMLETCRGPYFLINWIKCSSRWFHYTDILWCTVNKILTIQILYIWFIEYYNMFLQSRSAIIRQVPDTTVKTGLSTFTFFCVPDVYVLMADLDSRNFLWYEKKTNI
jgi:hypothetical protein